MKQPKWISRIRVARAEEPGYWAERGWSRHAVIRTLSRIDTPRDGERLRPGETVYIAGIAYAGGRPLERVEVSTDGGCSWRPAELKPEPAPFAWRLRALPWRPPAPGRYTLAVRAVEAGGRVQDGRPRDPLPEGATGWHRIEVRVAR